MTPGTRQRRAVVDRADDGVRVRRAHDGRIGLPGQAEVVGVASLPVTSRRSSLRRTGWPIPVPFDFPAMR